MDQDPSFVGKTSGISVCIAYRYGGNLHVFLCSKGSSITDRSPCFQFLDITDMAFQLHSRQKPYNIPFHLIRRINSINGDSGTDGIHVCFWHTDNACAVGTVLYRNSDSTFMKQSLKGHVTFQLFSAGEISVSSALAKWVNSPSTSTLESSVIFLIS